MANICPHCQKPVHWPREAPRLDACCPLCGNNMDGENQIVRTSGKRASGREAARSITEDPDILITGEDSEESRSRPQPDQIRLFDTELTELQYTTTVRVFWIFTGLGFLGTCLLETFVLLPEELKPGRPLLPILATYALLLPFTSLGCGFVAVVCMSGVRELKRFIHYLRWRGAELDVDKIIREAHSNANMRILQDAGEEFPATDDTTEFGLIMRRMAQVLSQPLPNRLNSLAMQQVISVAYIEFRRRRNIVSLEALDQGLEILMDAVNHPDDYQAGEAAYVCRLLVQVGADPALAAKRLMPRLQGQLDKLAGFVEQLDSQERHVFRSLAETQYCSEDDYLDRESLQSLWQKLGNPHQQNGCISEVICCWICALLSIGAVLAILYRDEGLLAAAANNHLLVKRLSELASLDGLFHAFAELLKNGGDVPQHLDAKAVLSAKSLFNNLWLISVSLASTASETPAQQPSETAICEIIRNLG